MDSASGSASLVPEQHSGVEKNFQRRHQSESLEDAEDLFVEAKERLLDVNSWHRLAGKGKARFQLVDGHCHPLKRHAHRGDFIRIELPGPASPVGGGYDWVHIEAVVYETDPDSDHECMAIRVRPSQAPEHHHSKGADHFFGNEATSTFVIERDHSLVTAGIYGRNEKPNTSESSLLGWLRHGFVALTAFVGGASVQWDALVKGFIEGETDARD